MKTLKNINICLLLLITNIIILAIIFKVIVLYNPKEYTQSHQNYTSFNEKYNNLKYNFYNFTTIPGLTEGAIPQGIVFYEKENKIIISAYHEGTAASVLHFINKDNGQYEKSIILYQDDNKHYKGHAGGLAISEDHLWVSANYQIFQYSLNDLMFANNMEKVVAEKHFDVTNKADYITYHDNMLWVGEYNYKFLYKTNKKHHITNDNENYKSMLFGYSINNYALDLKLAIAMPDKVQGITFDNDTIILSRSFWSFQESLIDIYNNPLANSYPKIFTENNKQIPLYFLSSKLRKEKIEIPSMSEGIMKIDNNLYILFESNANLYKYYTKDKTNQIYILNRKENKLNYSLELT